MEIGDDRLQGLDYTYTIHGWIKAVNNPFLNQFEVNGQGLNANDLGQDGQSGANQAVLKDAYGFIFGLF